MDSSNKDGTAKCTNTLQELGLGYTTTPPDICSPTLQDRPRVHGGIPREVTDRASPGFGEGL